MAPSGHLSRGSASPAAPRSGRGSASPSAPRPQALYIDLDHLLAWFAGAKPGGYFVRYAVAAERDRRHPVVAQVEEWQAAQVVETADDDAGGGFRNFRVRKASPGLFETLPAAPAQDERAGLLLELLARRAAAGDRQAPSYRTIAQALGLRDRFVARRVFEGLIERGAIRVEGAGGGRVVHILESGSASPGGSATARTDSS